MKFLIIGIALLAGLSACSLQSLQSVIGDGKPKTMESATASGVENDPMRIDTIAFADAYCRKDGKAAVAATQKLVVANPKHPRALLLYGLSLDMAGKGVSAYRVLDRLAAADHPMPAVLRCGDEFMYSGTVTEVAQRRAFKVKTELAALGLTMPLPTKAEHQAAGQDVYRLAAMAPTASPVPGEPMTGAHKAAADQKPMAGPRDDKTAKHRTPAGGRFVHLGSYKTTRTLEKGWKSLRKRFASVLGAQKKAVAKVNLGKKKGQYLRLGVSADNLKTARAICRKLKAGGQYCAVMPLRKS